jgi:hypothetical protein
MHTLFWPGNHKEVMRETLGVDRKIILKWILSVFSVEVGTGLQNKFQQLLWTRQSIFGFHNSTEFLV